MSRLLINYKLDTILEIVAYTHKVVNGLWLCAQVIYNLVNRLLYVNCHCNHMTLYIIITLHHKISIQDNIVICRQMLAAALLVSIAVFTVLVVANAI